jgi:intracellular multiplication protein IcmO
MSIEARYELKLKKQIVDVRPASEKFGEWLGMPLNLVLATAPLAILWVVVPMFMPIGLVVISLMVFAHFVNKPILPYRYPSSEIDPKKGKPGDGILFFGSVDSKSSYEAFKEVWLSDDDLRKHMLILGSTGSGKSETLKSIFFNSLAWSSGFFIADGKADNKLPVDVYSMVRSLGRDLDLLILNFLMAGKTPEEIRTSRRRRSNTLNPFSSADPDTIIQMGANLLPKVDGDAKNWQEKALNLWRALVTALCYLRDTQNRDLSITDFIEYLSLNKVEELYVLGYEESERIGDWSYGFVGIKNYLESGGCPGYQTSKLLKKHGLVPDEDPPARGGFGAKKGGNDQDAHAYEQHAYRTSQLMPALNLLDKSYGYIFKSKYPEIDMTDVTLRNRILVMLIPSLEKSAQEAESLGKLTIACLRVMMSKNLGSEVEGDYTSLIKDKATNSPYPYVAALDELAYYFSDGIAVMFAQARSLGICMIAAAQDLEKLTEGSRSAEAGAMFANQTTKFFMRIDDHNKTPEMITKIIGKAKVAVKKRYESTDLGWKRTSDIDVDEVDRVTLQQLQEFGAGQGVFQASGVTRMLKSFYMGLDLEAHRPKDFRVNRFLQVASPTPDEVYALSIPIGAETSPHKKGQELVKKLKHEEPVSMSFQEDPVINAIAKCAREIGEHVEPQERAIMLYLAATAALRAAKEVPSTEKPPKHDAQSFGPAGPASERTPEEVDPDDGTIDVLGNLFNPEMPFERKPADQVLGGTPEPVVFEKKVEPALPSAEPAIKAAIVDPMDVLINSGRSLNLGPGETYDNPWRPIKTSHKDPSWIESGLDSAANMRKTPRALDANGVPTVVGFTEPTLKKVESIEAVLGTENPTQSARVLEQVVSARLTPDTQSVMEIDPDNLDAFFQTLEDSINQ